MSSLFLTDNEIADICAPLVNPSAQVRFLKTLGLLVQRKPNGRPLVARCEFERALSSQSNSDSIEQSAQPNRAAYLKLINGGKQNGSQASK